LEPVCAPWKVEGIPSDFSFGELPPDWDRMGPYLETAMSRIPISKDVGIRKFFCGPESFTPDLQPAVGEAPELKNYFVAAGLNSVGILTGGGLGRVIAHWILNGRPDIDVTGMNIDRLHRYQANPDYRRARTVESLGTVYLCHYPTKSMQTARGIKQSAVHGRLAAQRAFFKDTFFHRIVPGFVIQGGDPTGQGNGGPGYATHDTVPANASYQHGVVAMAKTGADPAGTAGSQFFVVTGQDAGLPAEYAVVGKVTSGLDVVDKIGRLGDPNQQPTENVVIANVKVVTS